LDNHHRPARGWQLHLRPAGLTADTDLALDWYTDRPLMFKTAPGRFERVGSVDHVEMDDPDEAAFFKAQMDLANRYQRHVAGLIQQGAAKLCLIGQEAHAERSPSGRLERWPLIGVTVEPLGAGAGA
jgi:hypothetical protein